jgi:hypothetical protein
MVKFVVKNMHESAKVVEYVKNEDMTLEEMQKIVGGYIEFIPFPTDINSESEEGSGIDLILNEEGKLDGLRRNLLLIDANDRMFDVAVGNILFCAHDEYGETIGLTDEQIETAIKYCQKNGY